MRHWMRVQPTSVKNWLPNWKLPTWLNGPNGAALGMLLVGGLAFGLGRSFGLGAAGAQTPAQPKTLHTAFDDKKNADLFPEDFSGRVVAYIYGNIPVTRLELAEYLIARYGSERVEFLVNRKIVERACQMMGINVTDTEVELQLRKDCQLIGPNVTPEMFQKQILSKYNKTLFEWREDVIRPKLALQKMVDRQPIVVEPTDLQKEFDARYGAKVQCRMVVYEDVNKARAAWQRMRQGDLAAEFHRDATNQFIKDLCPLGGKVPPIHKHFTSPQIEQAAFMLRTGEISQVIEMPDRNAIILMCDEHLKADVSKSYEREYPLLLKEMTEQKRAKMMQDMMVDLRKKAAPRFIMTRENHGQIVRDAQQELQVIEPATFRKIDSKQ